MFTEDDVKEIVSRLRKWTVGRKDFKELDLSHAQMELLEVLRKAEAAYNAESGRQEWLDILKNDIESVAKLKKSLGKTIKCWDSLSPENKEKFAHIMSYGEMPLRVNNLFSEDGSEVLTENICNQISQTLGILERVAADHIDSINNPAASSGVFILLFYCRSSAASGCAAVGG